MIRRMLPELILKIVSKKFLKKLLKGPSVKLYSPE